MIQKKNLSKTYVTGIFLLLIIFALAAAIIYEKNKKEITRIIKINLDTKVGETLNWKFSTKNNFIDAKIGQVYKIDFNVENYSSSETSGKATYEVKPSFLKKYFVEIDCFCYKKQTLQPSEKSTYSITFYIDPKILSDFKAKDIKDINISYTFLNT